MTYTYRKPTGSCAVAVQIPGAVGDGCNGTVACGVHRRTDVAPGNAKAKCTVPAASPSYVTPSWPSVTGTLSNFMQNLL
ncbi:hypothetical protein NESM_000481600 [Novymonas esmeraldas]|uniref:Uncharacterized protein n=1 Tax=Novymonas esmeraldas TaxID=1808958 RepID=A0AAW0EN33_9TRYP